MWKDKAKKYNSRESKEEYKEKIKMNDNLCSWNYAFILVLFNLFWDYLCYLINKFWWMENIPISDQYLRVIVKIFIPLVLALFFGLYQKKIRKWFTKFSLNFIAFTILFLLISYIYIVTNK